MASYKIIDEYESGWKAVRGESKYYVESPSGKKTKFGNSSIGSNRRRTRLFAALCAQLGEVGKIETTDAVPTDVAVSGKAEIAAYLWAVKFDHYTPDDAYRPWKIADHLDVSEDTLSKYCSRVLRSVKSQKVG